MLRRRGRNASGRRGRRKDWEFSWFSQGDLVVDGDVFNWWIRAPADSVDHAAGELDFIVPTDATLLRLLCGYAYQTNWGAGQGKLINCVAVGVIPWEGTTDALLPISGEGAAPHPFYDGRLDWIYRRYFWSTVSNVVDGGTGTGPASSEESKAKRKLSSGTGLLLCCGYVEPSVTAEVFLDFAWANSQLLALP